MKKIFTKKGVLLAACVCVFMIGGLTVSAASSKDLDMEVASSCYVYDTKSTKTSAREDYVTFGQELEVKDYGSKWSTIRYKGKNLYIQSKNLKYREATVIKNRIIVSPGAYPSSTKSMKGYAYYGVDVSVLGEKKNKNGSTYVHCIVPAVYDTNGRKTGENVEGYINSIYLRECAVPKVVNGGTNLYANAYGASASASLKKPVGKITTGEQVDVIMSNATWSKVKYNNKYYYMSTGKLDPMKLYITVNRAAQTFDAKPGSGFQHYVYWNDDITVLNTYESDTYGTYFYCKIGGDYGFVREYSSSGLQYVGNNTRMQTKASTSMYKAAQEGTVLQNILPGETVTVLYQSGSWSKVSYQGKTGYILTSKLEYPVYQAEGAYYVTPYRLYKDNRAGTLNETVSLAARNDKYGYAYVLRGDGSGVWIRTSSLKEQESQTQYVAQPGATLHTSPSNDSESIRIPYMTPVTVMKTVSESSSGSWIQIEYDENTYYLWNGKGETLLTKTKSTGSYETSTKIQKEVVDLALDIDRNWSVKYAHGQSNGVADSDGKYGFDCSGFVSYVMGRVMQDYVPTYNISADLKTLYETKDIYNKGYTGAFGATAVDTSRLQPGDVLFFQLAEENDKENNNEGYNHCGIYLGNNEFVHCTHSWGGTVIVMPLTGMYEDGLVAAKRYLPQTVVSADAVRYTTSQKTGFYKEKSDASQQIATLPAETKVEVLFTDNGNWAYVRCNGQNGYILTKYLTESIDQEQSRRYVSATSVKLYKDHTTSSAYTEVLIGTEVTYLGRYSNSSYYKVSYQGEERYIYAPKGINTRLTDDYDALMKGTGTKHISANTKLRSSMSSGSDANQIRMLYADETVTVIAKSDSGTWCYVETKDGERGFVLAKYLK